MPHLGPSFADLEGRPLLLGAMQQASIATVLTRCKVGRVPDRVDRCLHSSTLRMGEHLMQLLTAQEYLAGVTFRALSTTSL